MFEKREIYRAIGELACVVSKAKKNLQPEEKRVFFKVIEEELSYNARTAESRFEVLDEVIHPTLGHAYNDAIFELRKYKDHLDDGLKQLTIRVLKKVSAAYHGSSEVQDFILDRLEKDLKHV